VQSRKRSGRILIIHTDGNTFNNPSLKCIIDLLLQNGFSIDLRYPKTFAPMPAVENVRFLPYGKLARRFKRIIFDQLCSRMLMYLLVSLERLVYYRKYDLILGVDRQGLLEADIICRSTGSPLIYISFEITFESETSAAYKALEKNAARSVACWIVQDEERAEKLKRENDLDDTNRMLLPLASSGIGNTSDTRLRDQLKIPPEKKVAIVIGSVSKWSMTKEIIRSVSDWPDNWVLVLHERYGRTRELLAGELNDLQNLLDRKIYISDSATELVDDMDDILSGVDVGLALYAPDLNGGLLTGNNLKFLGLASGKISTYLRYRIPVVVNEIGLYANEIRENKLGLVVKVPDNIPAALIKMETSDYSKNIENYFSSKLDFDIYADELLAKFKSIMSAA
jgi:hypothetical protein